MLSIVQLKLLFLGQFTAMIKMNNPQTVIDKAKYCYYHRPPCIANYKFNNLLGNLHQPCPNCNHSPSYQCKISQQIHQNSTKSRHASQNIDHHHHHHHQNLKHNQNPTKQSIAHRIGFFADSKSRYCSCFYNQWMRRPMTSQARTQRMIWIKECGRGHNAIELGHRLLLLAFVGGPPLQVCSPNDYRLFEAHLSSTLITSSCASTPLLSLCRFPLRYWPCMFHNYLTKYVCSP